MPAADDRKHATKQKIYDAAEQLFATQGFDSSSVAEIAAQAGVAKGTFFLHFPSKGDLLSAIGATHINQALDTIEGAERRDSWPFSRQVDHVFRTLARAVDSAGETMVMIVQQDAFDDVTQARLQGVFAELVKGGKRSSDLRADVLADRMSAFLFGVWRSSLAQWAVAGGNFERWVMESVRLALDGLTPR